MSRVGALAPVALTLLAVTILAGCGGGSKAKDTKGVTVSTSGPTTSGTVKHQGKPAPLKVTLSSEQGLKKLDLSVFATLTQGRTVVATQRLSTKSSVFQLYKGDYVLSIAFSPCQVKGQKRDCGIFHGGSSLSPVHLKGGSAQRIVVVPSCRKVSYGQGFDCAATKVGR